MSENESKAITSFQGDDGFSAERTIARRLELEKLFSMFKENVHFGKIPGCDKPSLFKPGAELVAQMMGVRPEYEKEEIDLPGGHKEYRYKCHLFHIQSGIKVGEHESTCSTTESKYAFRTEIVKDENDPDIHKSPPKEWWETKNPELIGGNQFRVRKKRVFEKKKWIEKWVIIKFLPVENPSDNYHTCKSQGMKRSFVGAIRTLSACSDKFTDSVEDFENAGFMGNGEKPKEKSRFDESPPPKNGNKKKNGKVLSDEQVEKMEKKGVEIFGDFEKFYEWMELLTEGRIKSIHDIVSTKQYGWVMGQLKDYKEKTNG